MKEDKIVAQTYLFFSKNFPKFSLTELNEVLTSLQPVLPQETLREKDSVGTRHYSSFQKGFSRVVTTKCSKGIAQNVKQGLA